MALVIKSWKASNSPQANGEYIRIVGREEGVLSWLLSKVGVEPITTIVVTEKVIFFNQGSLAGFQKRVIPVSRISSTYYGYSKPWQMALVLFIVLSPFFFIGFVIGPLYYFLNKTLSLGFVEDSGVLNGIEFKRSIIEGQNINEQETKKIVDILRELIESHDSIK